MFRTESIERMICLMPIASKDVTRYNLNSIALSRNDGKSILIEVTDGHKMVREIVNDDSLASLLEADEKLLIHRDQIGSLKNAVGFGSIDRERKLLLFPGGAVSYTTEKYPNCAQIEPDEKDLTHKIGFNAQYIIDLAKALKDGKAVNVVLKVKFEENKTVLAPMIVQVGHRKAILMPVRV